jgi:hypothetical protein
LKACPELDACGVGNALANALGFGYRFALENGRVQLVELQQQVVD